MDEGEREALVEEERRKNTLRIPVPWSRDPIEARGLTVIILLQLIATTVLAVALWRHQEDAKLMPAAIREWAFAQRELVCVLKIHPDRRSERYLLEECERESRRPL